ncbi:MAG: tRNA (adenosine(37)-N6)-dimethylallyltransferase MiaA [Actinomycetota bacterium]|nr:tRNA (adenosine(37)-N6)-dimethylallyltransferase MiaA [Actinomycetota bacterium]
MRHLALVGCTASGKSSLAMAAARALGDVEIVTVDSMQVYRGMDIGTAKPSRSDRIEVPHHLLDLADPAEDWDLATWCVAADDAIASVERRGHRALLVGGTGMYFQALVDGWKPPGRYPEVAAELAAESDTVGLHRRLAALDPVAASRMEPANRRRVLRALEVTVASGRPFSTFGPGVAAFTQTAWRLAGIWLPRPVVAARIAARFEAMLGAGLVEEIRVLGAHPGGLSRTARQALGYRELLQHLEEGAPLEAMVEEAVRRTRAFARRQRVWWRRDPRIAWYGAAENPFAVLPALLGDWRRP